MLVAYDAPDRNFNSIKKYKTGYPGDDIIDIFGMDNYHDLKQRGGESKAIQKLYLIIELARSKNKLVAFTETRLENITDSTWFTQKLGKVLNNPIVRKVLSYVMVWRSNPEVHFFFLYPGHPAAADAKLLQKDFNKILSKQVNK